MSITPISIGLPSGTAGWKILQSKSVTDFTAFTKNPTLQRDIVYLREKLPTKLAARDLLADRRLQEMVLTAYGLDSQIGMNALMQKVLESDPADSGSVAARMVDSRYKQISSTLNYGGIAIPEIPAMPSGATVQVEGIRQGKTFESFSGTFGGVTVSNLDLSKASNRIDLAATLQAAFRKADGRKSDITVTALGGKLSFTDGKGRGAAVSFAFVASPGTTAQAALTANTTGSVAVPAQGGPAVTKSATVEEIVARFTQARFEESLGETSETLRRAVYAKRSLPGVTSWYSVIADRNLASVVQGVLGLPESFGQINVDQQKAMLERRMDIADFKDSAKLAKLLDRYVAQSGVAEAQALASSSGIATLVQPIAWGGDSFTGSSAAALFSVIGGR
ncbi:DUF1217 domain-containing protein [Pseudoroseomonas wenyumeiae]|uniref:DUF1217 domain-containing protein n=1 Tax=Teichococcus wenyumeiae TaxID=2478470 RepID=A0A3A9JIV7_9PROT|nr:DUF1217 domain-containing protein [Pseudoroseomonas wenyumeiae]RKK03656.1 DUF1217 domain-containing protein [Pseudoroseomonas wenyumeiae]RMI20121.1 DUF1217 domain-containing protein [Pseudoroseomonas wenyumeiae]